MPRSLFTSQKMQLSPTEVEGESFGPVSLTINKLNMNLSVYTRLIGLIDAAILKQKKKANDLRDQKSAN